MNDELNSEIFIKRASFVPHLHSPQVIQCQINPYIALDLVSLLPTRERQVSDNQTYHYLLYFSLSLSQTLSLSLYSLSLLPLTHLGTVGVVVVVVVLSRVACG